MAKKIISQTRKISFRLLNVGFFFIASSIVIIIVFYQLFVDQNYRPLGWKRWLNFQTIKTIIASRQIKNESCLKRADYVFLTQNNTILIRDLKKDKNLTIALGLEETLIPPFFLNQTRQKTGYLSQKENQLMINIYDLNSGQHQQSALGGDRQQVGIINFDDFDNLYFYDQDKTGWDISFYNGMAIKPILTKINYNGDHLTRSTTVIKNFLVFPECNSQCQFVVYNIADQSRKSIPITTESAAQAVEAVELIFYDESIDKMIYQIPQTKTAYITDFNGYLWHHIYLEPVTGNLINLNGALIDNQGQKQLVASSKVKKQAYIYDINFIGLKLIDLNGDGEVFGQQLNQPSNCLLLEDKNKKEFILKDIATLKEEKLDEPTDYLQIF